MSIEDKLNTPIIEILNPPDPVGNYSAFINSYNLIFISSQLPILQDGSIVKGKIRNDLTIEEGEKATRIAILNVLGQLKKATNDLNLVKRCVKITGYYNCSAEFKEHAKLLNIASDLIVNIFGDKGKHARAVIGANTLPLDAAVELETIFEV